jgi:hypothetical protein
VLIVGVGLLSLAVLVVGLVVVLRMARGSNTEDEAPPPSSDFVAPVSSGAFRFRKAEETPETFHDRLKHEDEEIASSKRGG